MEANQNPIGLDGMEFLEYTTPNPQELEKLFLKLGFEKIGEHKQKKISLYRQSDINFLINFEASGFEADFRKAHGPSICSAGFRVKNAKTAFENAVARGARAYKGQTKFPAIYGIGDSLIYFIEKYGSANIYDEDFNYTSKNIQPKGLKLEVIDHLTNNVPRGEMQKWCDFYQNIFNFKEVRYFDIKGTHTGLISKVMKSPCGKIIIPINEPSDSKSQIQEYLEEYHGSGIQHVALYTDSILDTVKSLKSNGIGFLETPDTYYELIPNRDFRVTEKIEDLKSLKILVDGDPEGYLLQIFTQNLIGPIFFEIIQRKNHYGFGNGNFQALFDAIERDQMRRGVL